MGKRPTNSKDVNAAVAPYIAIGWTIERRGVRGQNQVLVPPDEVLKANPGKSPTVPLHTSPSDSRAHRNLIRDLRKYHDPRDLTPAQRESLLFDTEVDVPSKWFCRTCGPGSEEFLSVESRNTHEEKTHPVKDKGKHLWSAENPPPPVPNRQCPWCPWNMSGRNLSRHMQTKHNLMFTKVNGSKLSVSELEALPPQTQQQAFDSLDTAIQKSGSKNETVLDLLIQWFKPEGLRIMGVEDAEMLGRLKELSGEIQQIFDKLS